jgi:glycosyltransferase involved in cell wall biosynthesis
MKISVVIPSYNGEHKLPNCLDALNKQTTSNFEVVVVIDGSTDKSLEILSNYLGSRVFNLVVIETLNGGRATARNTGFANASSEMILFLDDDAIPEFNLIEKHLNFHETNKDQILVGGGYRNPILANSGFSKYLVFIENKWRKNHFEKRVVDFNNFVFSSNNLSLSKELFLKLNQFDERLKDAEDFDLGVRALINEMSVFYDNSVISWHNDWPNLKEYIKRHNQYVKANADLVSYYPEYLKWFPKLIPNKTNTIKCFILKLFRYTVGPFFINENIFLKFLPLKFRFKCYQFTISAYSINNSR